MFAAQALLLLSFISPLTLSAQTVSARPGGAVFVELREPGPVRILPPMKDGEWSVIGEGERRVVMLRSGVPGRFEVFAGGRLAAVVLVHGIGIREIAWLLGGLLLFLFGMNEASHALRRSTGGTLRAVLQKVTASRFVGVAVGVLLSVALQSSSAATVMLVGLASAGLLTLKQAVPVVMGASLGTTLTVQIIAFDLADYALLMVGIGALVVLVSPYRQWAYLGRVVVGFGLIFLGMGFMKDGVAPLKAYPALASLFAGIGRHPLLAVLLATAVTGVIQSSAATIAIGMSLAATGMIDFRGAVAVVLGANIGTTVTALLSCIGAKRVAVQTAVVHFIYKVAGVILVLPFVWMADRFEYVFTFGGGVERAIANFHTVVNVVWVVAGLAFTGPLARLTRRLVPDASPLPEKDELDESLLGHPVAALEAVARETARMAALVGRQVEALVPALLDYSGVELERLETSDEKVDATHRRCIEFLRRMATSGMSQRSARAAGALMYVLRDLEAIGDLVSKDVVKMGYKRLEKDKVMAMGDVAALRRLAEDAARFIAALRQGLASGVFQVPLSNEEERRTLQEVVAAVSAGREQFQQVHAEHFHKLQEGVTEAVESDSLFVDFLSLLRQIHYIAADAAAALCRPHERHGFSHPMEVSE